MKKRNGAKKWPLGFGVLYLMINFPLVIFVKIGITGVGASKRAKQVDEAAPGVPIPIMIMVLPFVYQVEQFLHAIFSPLRVSYYKGDGHTEWFLAVAGIPVFWLGVKYWFFLWDMIQLILLQ
jgi:hypothetical protein